MNDPIALVQRLMRESGVDPGRRTPPVHLWNPPDCGESSIEILADGSWRHEGTRIAREGLVRLFASILRKDEDGTTWLVTPAERMRVRVEDAPFVAVRADREGEGRAQVIAFTTNVADVVIAGPEHPIRVVVDAATGAPRPYVLVRGRLEARILRAPFYELVAWGEEGPGGFGVWSAGAFFPLQ